jgi:hypothetical protein
MDRRLVGKPDSNNAKVRFIHDCNFLNGFTNCSLNFDNPLWHDRPPSIPIGLIAVRLAELQMKLRENGRFLCAFAQKLTSIKLQSGEKIINCTVDISSILSTMALYVFRVRAIDANVHSVPSAMPALWTSRTAPMSAQILAFSLECHGFISLSLRDATMERRQESARLSL